MKYSFLKLFLLFWICCATAVSFSQTPIAMEKVTAPTPEAAALGKFGTYPVGLFTGTPNVQIPLYSMKAKKIEVPISLSYSSNGLRVDEMPTKVGMTWVLNAGGAITRTVYDRADDQYTRANFPYSDAQLTSTTSSDLNVPAWVEGIDAPPSQPQDTQFDEYAFNFSGYSGKFIIDLNNNPVLIPYSNLRIQLNPFRITTPDGLQYEFTAPEAPSYTLTGGCSRDNSHPFNSAWYLTKITNLNDPTDYVTITYVNGSYIYHPQINQTITYYDPTNICQGGGITDPCGCSTPCAYGTPGSSNLAVDNFCSNTVTVSVPYISEITSSLFGKVKFIYNTSYNTSATPIAIDRLLTNIQVYQNNNGTNLLKSFDLSYLFAKPSSAGKVYSFDNMATEDPDMNSYRPFLNSLKEKDNTGIAIKTHNLEYNDVNNLTARLSSSQDYWGFYNGKNNYNSFIPANSSGLLPKERIADRNPDYIFAVKGMLSKVVFPTGGSTQFIYEGNTSRAQPVPTASPIYNVATNVQATNLANNATFYVLTPTVVSINRSIACCSGGVNTCALAGNSLVWGQINKVINGVATTIKSYSFAEYNQRGECSFSQIENITLQPGTYGLRIFNFNSYQLTLNAIASNGGTIYLLNTNNPPSMTSLATDGGGVRVKQQIIYDPVSQISTTTNYQYAGMVIPYTPVFLNSISYKKEVHLWYDGGPNIGIVCQVGPTPCAELKSCNYSQYSSNSSVNTTGRGGSPVYYTSVTESTGDNFVIGGTEHTYNYVADAGFNFIRGNVIPNSTYPSSNWKNGEEINQNTFKLVNGVKVYLKKVSNAYTSDSRVNNSYTQYITKRSGNSETTAPSIPDNCTANSVFNLRMNVFDIASYTTRQEWRYLSAKTEINYDQDGTNPLTTTTNYFYDNALTAMLTRVETANSKGQPVKVINKYPGDELSITNLNASETDAITKLKNQNNYSPVLENEQYINNILQKRIHIGYKDVGSGILKPEVIKEQIQANGIESKIQFQQYDNVNNNGNLLLQNKTNDALNSYIWDYKKSLPIAEVINATNTEIAYTSFESDGTGNWTFTGTISSDPTAPTGKKVYNLTSGAITKTVSSTTIYTVSYWRPPGAGVLSITGTQAGYPVTGRTTANGWSYYEHKITGVTTATVSGTGNIDELRLYPSTAQMTTYTFEPLVGATSVCDLNNRITYYEYDGLQRLAIIKDQDNKVVKKYCYNYAGQTENCNVFYNVVKSGTFTRNNCTAGFTGSSVTYTVPAGKYNATTQAVADQMAQDDVTLNGQTYANANGTCTQSCSFSSASGFNVPSSSISSSAGTVTFSITFNSLSGTTSWSALNTVATINGTCKPTGSQAFTVTANSRVWQVSISTAGLFTVQLLSGTAPLGTSTVTLSGTYSN